MSQIHAFLKIVDAYNAALALSDTTTSWRVFQDSKKIAALRDGRDIQVKRLEAAIRWFAAHWPAEAVWPDDSPQPALEA